MGKVSAALTSSHGTKLIPGARRAVGLPWVVWGTWGHSAFQPPLSPSAMDEWDLPQWKKEVESLKYQLAYKREMSSKTIPE